MVVMSESPPEKLSSEQKMQIEERKLKAETRRLSSRFSAKDIGISWVKALLDEFKKPYIQDVSCRIRQN